MTLDESRLTVFAMTAPHPSRKACEITLKFVPGWPDAITTGFGRFRPSTVVANVGILCPLFPSNVVDSRRTFEPNFKPQITRRRRPFLLARRLSSRSPSPVPGAVCRSEHNDSCNEFTRSEGTEAIHAAPF